MQTNKCQECGKPCHHNAKYCKKCWQKGKRNAMYGKHSWNYQGSLNYCCMDCGELISKPTALKGGGRCRSCSRKGKLSWNKKYAKKGKEHHAWKGGLPHCIDCGKELSFYTCKRCLVCDRKYRYKNNEYIRKQLQSPHRGHKIIYKNHTLRSSWEYILAYWLDLSNIKWKYEQTTFDLGDTTYTPDFYLPEFDCYIEVKGWWRENSKQKFKRFLQKYNKIAIHIFQQPEFYQILGLNKRALNYFANKHTELNKGEK